MVTKSGFLNLQIQIYENQLTRIHSLFVCLFGRLRPTRYFFTHMETSPSPVKGYTF